MLRELKVVLVLKELQSKVKLVMPREPLDLLVLRELEVYRVLQFKVKLVTHKALLDLPVLKV